MQVALVRRLLLVLGIAAMTAGVALLLIEGDEGYFLMAVVGFAAVAFVAAVGGPPSTWVPPEPDVVSEPWPSDTQGWLDTRPFVPVAGELPAESRVVTERASLPEPGDRTGPTAAIEPSPAIESPPDRLVTAQDSDSSAALALPSTGPLTPSERAERFVQRPGGAAATLAGALAVLFGLRRFIRG